MSSKLKLALIQMMVGPDKSANISRAIAKISEAAQKGAKLVVLPECFNSPYGTQYFKEYAEKVPGPTTDHLATAVKQLSISLIGGSIPEQCTATTNYYNTTPLFNFHGFAGKFRKMHLFDIDIPGKITFKESESLTPGDWPVIFDVGSWKVGLGVCYDVRFSELAEVYSRNACNLLVYPGAFNMTTGPAHWQLMAQARATQTQCYVAMCSPARDTTANYVAWGHSIVVDPWGEVIASTDEGEDIVYAEICLDRVDEVRSMIPLRKQRRTDIYETTSRIQPLVVT